MNPIGTARRIDQLGRVVVPVELRRLLGIREGDLLDIRAQDGHLVLDRIEPSCIFCGEDSSALRERHGKHVCAGCLADLTTA
ncbi:MAG TPA: AbrB/MazE/SpoVT family DNA-binding domain-containing protein [Acidimicrobiia bacterium]|nr:AbrB/MazE/SpoVT family DNA-binding domain-containing protein [Acidimicrobiia bacterium]